MGKMGKQSPEPKGQMKIRAKQYTRTQRLTPGTAQRPHCPRTLLSSALPTSGAAMTPVGPFCQLQPTNLRREKVQVRIKSILDNFLIGFLVQREYMW